MKEDIEEKDGWRCFSCGTLNLIDDKFCDCGGSRDEDEDDVEIPEEKPKRIVLH